MTIKTLHNVLSRAGLPVLAADLGKLRKLQAAKPVAHMHWTVPRPEVVQPAVRAACVIAGGKLLLWRDSGMLALVDRLGAPLWQQQLDSVVALIPVASSPNVLVVQTQPDGTHLLSRFASQQRKFHSIGAVRDLKAWHDVTAEGHWLVQIGGDIGALDLARLCAPTPEIHFLWSCQLTERLQVLAFAHLHARQSWITRDISPDRNGVLELWTLQASGHMTTALCLPPPLAAVEIMVERHRQWRWDASRIAAPDDPNIQMRVALWTEGGDSEARTLFAARDDRDTFQSCDFQRASVHHIRRETEPAYSVVSSTIAPVVTITLDPRNVGNLFCLARGGGNAGTALLADEEGRLFVVDIDKRRITTI